MKEQDGMTNFQAPLTILGILVLLCGLYARGCVDWTFGRGQMRESKREFYNDYICDTVREGGNLQDGMRVWRLHHLDEYEQIKKDQKAKMEAAHNAWEEASRKRRILKTGTIEEEIEEWKRYENAVTEYGLCPPEVPYDWPWNWASYFDDE